MSKKPQYNAHIATKGYPMSKPYTVTWTIEIDAINAYNAAEQALDIMQDRKSTASVFIITDQSTDRQVKVDLINDTEERISSE